MSFPTSQSVSSLSSPDAPPYQDQRLKGRRSIRVLELLPDKKGAPLRCNMREISLDEPPNYEAVSYVWGAPEFVKRIFCGAEVMSITKSCSHALHHLRRTDRTRLLWIDACCINQTSDDERGHQVGLMGDVYRTAHCTVVWLGQATRDTDKSALKYIRSVGRDPKAKEGTQRGGFCCEKSTKLQAGLAKDELDGLYCLFNKAWFHRVWVCLKIVLLILDDGLTCAQTVQEFALSRNCVIMCGEVSIRADHLMTFLNLNKKQTLMLERFDRVHLHRQMWQ
jgi:hypothetical protein